jgi:flagellar basal-body rod modification protein FlgD
MSLMSMISNDQNAGAAARVAQSLVTSHAAASTSTSSTSTTSSSTATDAADTSGITSNDFLTLLVTEMKNQDPTQPTDPNAYIQQLVGVNSLQQLISINQELSSVGTTGTTTPTATAGSQVSSVSGS